MVLPSPIPCWLYASGVRGVTQGGLERGRRPFALRVGLGAVAVGLVGATVTTTLAGTEGDAPAPTTTTLPTLSGPAAELAELLETRQRQAYHARYEGSSEEASSIVIETWQDADGRVRQDQILSTAGQGAHLVSLDGDEGPVRCTRISEQEWTCRRAAPADAGAADPIAGIRSRLAGSEVHARDEHIDGGAVRCFTLDAAGEASELCVRPATGIPVRIGAGQTELRLVLLEEAVDPAVFEPPGPVT